MFELHGWLVRTVVEILSGATLASCSSIFVDQRPPDVWLMGGVGISVEYAGAERDTARYTECGMGGGEVFVCTRITHFIYLICFYFVLLYFFSSFTFFLSYPFYFNLYTKTLTYGENKKLFGY